MQRAARKAAPRLRRDFGEVEQLQVSRKGPADFVSMADKRAEQTLVEELRNARPDWGMLLEEGGEIEGNPDQAALDRRSARRHHQLPPRHPAFRHLDRGRGAASPTGEREITPRPGLPAADRRELLGRKGPGRLAQRPAPARLGAPRPRRGADRHRHPAFRARRRRRAGRKIYGAIAPEVSRHPPLRLGRARPRLGRGGPVRRLLGRRSRHLGHRRGHAAGQGSGRLRHRLSRAGPHRSSAANISPPTASLH